MGFEDRDYFRQDAARRAKLPSSGRAKSWFVYLWPSGRAGQAVPGWAIALIWSLVALALFLGVKLLMR